MAKNGKFLRESGRLKYTEKSFIHAMGDGEPRKDCKHGWYTKTRKPTCVWCSKPEADCLAADASTVDGER